MYDILITEKKTCSIILFSFSFWFWNRIFFGGSFIIAFSLCVHSFNFRSPEIFKIPHCALYQKLADKSYLLFIIFFSRCARFFRPRCWWAPWEAWKFFVFDAGHHRTSLKCHSGRTRSGNAQLQSGHCAQWRKTWHRNWEQVRNRGSKILDIGVFHVFHVNRIC